MYLYVYMIVNVYTHLHAYERDTCLITLSCKGLCADNQNLAHSCSARDLTRVVAITYCELPRSQT